MRRRPTSGSGGQVQLEYLGLALLVAGIVAALVLASIPSRVAGGIRTAVCEIIGGQDCAATTPAAQRPHSYYQPDKCLVSKSTDTYGGSLSVAFVHAGVDVTFIRQELSNGKVKLTAAGSSSVGATTGIGAEASFGKVLNAQATADVSGELKIKSGDTWVFDSPGAADEFIKDYRATYIQEAAANTNPVTDFADWAWDSVTGGPDIREPTVTRRSVSLNAAGNANAGLGFEVPGIVSNEQRAPRGGNQGGATSGSDGGSGSNGAPSTNDGSGGDSQGSGNSDPHADDKRPLVDPSLRANAGLHATGEIIISHNRETGERSVTYKLGGGAQAGVSYITDDADVNASRSGAMKVTRNKNDQVVSIEFTRATTVNGETSIVRTKLDVDDPRQRRIVNQWLGANNDVVTTAQLTWDSMVPKQHPDAAATPFERLMYREAEATDTTYTSSKNAQQYGAEVRYGLVLGAEVHHLSNSLDVESSRYLGAPREGNRSYVTYEECHT